MKAFKNHVRHQTLFSEYGVFKDIHIPLLVFQANALRHVSRKFHVSRVDFLVLSAGFTIAKNSLMSNFQSPQISKTLTGVSPNVVYKALNRLLKNRLIALGDNRQINRRFVITDHGLACIQSYVQSYNNTISNYPWVGRVDCLK